MADASPCSVDGCERRSKARGLCMMHYKRVRARGEVGPAGGLRQPSSRSCSESGCDRQVGRNGRHGRCQTHYAAYRRTEGAAPCTVDGCDRHRVSHGLCSMHLYRWRARGEVGPAGRVWGDSRAVMKHHFYGWGEGGYGAAHRWVAKVFGPASESQCIDCGETADEWSYIGGAPDERIDPKDRAFSRDPVYYQPRCVKCHRIYDSPKRKRPAN